MIFSKIIEKKFDAVLGRYEYSPAQIHFESLEEWGVKREAFPVKGNLGQLMGYFYYKDDLDPKKLIVFDHGIGAGHLAYMTEIKMLVENGFTVYSYDHSGCAKSEGSGILGFAQAVNDLDHVLSAIRLDNRFWDTDLKLMGHSWGGYAVMNVLPFHPEVTHVVSLAGFLSTRLLVEQYLPKFVRNYEDEVMDREREHNPMYADLDARNSLKTAEAAFLYMQSKDDDMVDYHRCVPLLQEALQNRPNTSIVSFNHKGHYPTQTEAAVQAEGELKKEWEKISKKGKNIGKEQWEFAKSRNWNLLLQQDQEVWNQIFAFLEK